MNNKKTNAKNIRRLSLIILLCVVMLVLTLISCKKQDDDVSGDTTAVENSQISELLKGKLDTYQFVRSETMKEKDLNVLLSFANVLRKKSNETVTLVGDDDRFTPIIDNEVIIGETSRKGNVYNDGEGVITQTDSYTVQIVNSRLIFTYADNTGMMEGLEYLLLCIMDGEQSEIRDVYELELFDRDIMRHTINGFTLKNHINEKTVLSANGDMLFIGTGPSDSNVTVQLKKKGEVISSFEGKADGDGIWKTAVTPNTDADLILIRVDGKIAYGKEISFAESKVNTCADGTKVYIDGKQVNVHSNDGGNHVIASLADSSKKSMEVKIERSKTIKECVIRPLNEDVKPVVKGKTVTFTVSEFPIKLSVEFDGFDLELNPMNSVQLFLYEYEAFEPDLSGRELVYFAPGEHWIEENISLNSNTTVHVAEGAILHAKFLVSGVNNVVVEGRGIIDTYYFKEQTNMMTFDGCSDITLKDYMLTGPRKWMVKLFNSNNCTVDTLNIVGTEMNSDGVDIVGCTDVTVQNCYIKSNDDCIAIKSHGNNVNNVRVKGCVFWNLKYGNTLEIGYETRCESISNITFEDNDIIHQISGACMSIHLGDRATVSTVIYKNIRIDDAYGKLIELFIRDTQYTVDKKKGNISNIKFENIKLYNTTKPLVVIEGYSSAHIIENVSIEKIWQYDEYITKDQITIQKNKHIANIKYDNKTI